MGSPEISKPRGSKKNYDYIIVGGGHCGLILAKELSDKNKKVLVLEKGRFLSRVGNVWDAATYFDKCALAASRQGVTIYRTFGVGGTGVVGCGNAVEFTDKEHEAIGIDFKSELAELKKESYVHLEGLPSAVGKASQRIMQEANNLGYSMGLMPKFNKTGKCMSCGQCAVGCKYGVKWNSRDSYNLIKNGSVDLITDFSVKKIVELNGRVEGVEGEDGKMYLADKVILSAGGIGTPIILQNSGLAAGDNLFVDAFTMTYGVSKEYNQRKELPMSVVCTRFHESDGFVMAPFVDPNFIGLFTGLQFSKLAHIFGIDKLMGIMVKINDDNIGRVNRDGSIDKEMTASDQNKLKKGSDIAKEILVKCGVNPKTIFVTKVKGAHPGGTAAIGKVVDKNLQTKIKNLYVCDCSVFPFAPGLPPMLSLIALTKWFAKTI